MKSIKDRSEKITVVATEINTADIKNGNSAPGTDKNVAYTYMVRCRDHSLYTGWTNHLEERVKAHNEGKGAKYTRSRGPVELVYAEIHGTKQEAMSREAKIKRFTKKEKENLVKIYQENLQNQKETE